jgi:hypothetical protein
MSYASDTSEVGYHPVCAALAWVWPGLGHIARGEKRRGLYIMVGVLFLFLTGVLIGGVDAVDRKEDQLWYVAQVCCGPVAMAVDLANQSLLKTGKVGEIIATQPAPINTKKSLGRANEYGTLFTALAGLMNLVVILDAFHRRSRVLPDRRRGEHTSVRDVATAGEPGTA